MDQDDHLSCGVCYHPFSMQNRPFDLGCGHSFCENCLKANARSFRHCPECRTRATNPHANIALMRLLEQTGHQQGTSGAGAGAGANAGPQRRPQGGARPGGLPPSPIADILNAPPGSQPQGRLGTLLNKLPANMPIGAVLGAAAGAAGTQGSSASVVAQAAAGLGNVASHQAKISSWRTAMWVYLAPLLGFLYLVSPLDLIPDVIPIIGWVDDLLVVWYVAVTVYRAVQERSGAAAAAAAGARPGGTRDQQQQPEGRRR